MDGVSEFIKIAVRYPLLTQQQEIQLGRRIQAWLKNPEPTAAQIRSGQRAREHFICCNLRLVIAVAKKYQRRISGGDFTFADLLQEGVIGLQRATEKYDPECGYKMSTYAYWWIRQAITRAIETRSSMIRISADSRRKLQKFREAAIQGGTTQEILARAGLRDKDMHFIEQAQQCIIVHCTDDASMLDI